MKAARIHNFGGLEATLAATVQILKRLVRFLNVQPTPRVETA